MKTSSRVRQAIRPRMVNTKKRDQKAFGKGTKSRTRPGLLDFTTKKTSKFHVINSHEIKSMPRPFSGSRRANVSR